MLPLVFLACHADPTETQDTGGPVEDADLLTTLTEPGPYAVGYRQSALSYPDPASEGAADRSLRLALWYPSSDSAGEVVRYYNGMFEATDVLGDASVADGAFPRIVFSHGHQGYAENSSFLMVHLASHGFVVAAPDHTDNTLLDGSDRATAIYYQRPLDLSAVLDHLEQGGEPALEGHLSDDPVTLFGHSFGGYSAFAAGGAAYDTAAIDAGCLDGTGNGSLCSDWSDDTLARFGAGFLDERFASVVPMAPGDQDLFGDGAAQVAVPVFLMNGDLDGATTGSGDPYWASVNRGPDRRLVITGGAHDVFTDFSGLLDPVPGEIDPEQGFRIVDAYALAWAWRTLGDERAAALLDGELEVSEAALLYP